MLGAVAEIHHAAAAVVEGPGVHAGRDFQEVAPVATGLNRHVTLELAGDVQHVARLAHFEHRRIARDRHGFLQRADLHGDVDLKRGAGAEKDLLALVAGEAGELGGDRVCARREVNQPVIPFRVGDSSGRLNQRCAGRRDRYARHGTALLVFDVAAQAPLPGLCRRVDGDEKQDHTCQSDRSAHHHDLRKGPGAGRQVPWTE